MSRNPTPRYRADRDCWFAQVDGRRVTLARGRRNRAAARDALVLLLADRQRGHAPRSDRLVGELCELRLDRVIRDLAPRTAQGTAWYLNQFTREFGRVPVSSLTPHAVEAWLDRRAWGAQTRRNAITVIKAALVWGVKVRLIPASPLAEMARPSVKPRPLCVGRGDLEKILPWVRSEEFAEYLQVLSATGCRPSELARLEAGHLRPSTMTAVMDGKTTRKTGRSRVIHFPADAWAIVERRARQRPAGPLFLTEDGRPWGADARNTQIRSIRARAARAGVELPRFDSYSLRHGFITDALEAGLTSSEVAALVGNSSAVIDRVYDHLHKRGDAMRAALERVRGR
jgi:integrase